MLEAYAVAGPRASVGVDVEPADLGATLAGDGRLGVFAGSRQAEQPATAMGSGRDQTLHGSVRQGIEQ